jgi:ABC-type transport system substrate-binding protein
MKAKHLLTLFGYILILVLLVTSCSSATPTSTSVKAPTSSALVATSSAPVTNTQAPTSVAPTTTTAEPAKPQGELVAAFTDLGNENFLPWLMDAWTSQLAYLVYDQIVYYDEVNRKYLPGLAESWEMSPDAMTLTYHLRKGVEFSDGWGELTSEDIKYYFQQQKAPGSIGKIVQVAVISSMDTPDPYTLVVKFGRANPTFLGQFSPGEGTTSMGIASKKYIETVGQETAAQKPIGSGPLKLIEAQTGSYYKFEAKDSHWRVVPEFKTLIVRSVPEMSTVVAMLKTKELDLANITSEQMPNLKASGIAAEVNTVGGSMIDVAWGGICIPEDKRFNAEIHNKDPWADVKVRKAMMISIDRDAICKAIFAGGATPAGVPLPAAGWDKYQYPYDPTAAKQLLKEAGYPDGFSFNFASFVLPGYPETPRLIEAVAGYWQQIGLQPKISIVDYNNYTRNTRGQMKTAGDVSVQRISQSADLLDRAGLFLIPNATAPIFMDSGSYAIYQEGVKKMNVDERREYTQKLNQYYFENFGPGPLVQVGVCWAWNPDKVSPFPHPSANAPYYLEYVRHAKPLNTFRLFSPWADR